MEKKFYLLLIFCLFPYSVSAKNTNVTIYVDNAYQPYSFSENGVAQGIYVDILKVAFSRMKNYTVALEGVPWNRGKKIMAKGEGFALAPPYYHGHDWSYLYPYSLPLYTEETVAVCSNKVLETNRVDWPKDYLGLLIGNVVGFDGWGGNEFKQLVKDKKIALHEVQNANILIKMMSKNRLDCIIMEKAILSHSLKSYKEEDINFAISTQIAKHPVYLGYSAVAIKNKKYPFYADFKKAFDIAIFKMKHSGEIERIIQSYLNK